jgi:hypothetical protein
MPRALADDADSAFDERGVQKQYDQHGNITRMRVPMMLRDAAARDADRREVQRQIKAERSTVVDGAGYAGFGLCRPGPRRMADSAIYAEAATAYEQRVRDGEDAWRRGPDQQLDASPIEQRHDSARAMLDWRSSNLSQLIEDSERIKAQARAEAGLVSSEAWRKGPGA